MPQVYTLTYPDSLLSASKTFFRSPKSTQPLLKNLFLFFKRPFNETCASLISTSICSLTAFLWGHLSHPFRISSRTIFTSSNQPLIECVAYWYCYVDDILCLWNGSLPLNPVIQRLNLRWWLQLILTVHFLDLTFIYRKSLNIDSIFFRKSI